VSVELLELAADALGDLLNQVVFVGGATLTLWMTDPGAPPARPTKDVDVVVEIRTRTAFAEFEGRLRARDFSGDQERGVICRWRHRQGLILDAMPSDPSILGFANQWQGAGLAYAVERELPSGAIIRALTPPYLLATKLEAFKGRGHRDYLASPDFDDIIALVDGREEVVNEVANASADVRDYLSSEVAAMLRDPRFDDGLFAVLRPDAGSQARAERVIVPRLHAIRDKDPGRTDLVE